MSLSAKVTRSNGAVEHIGEMAAVPQIAVEEHVEGRRLCAVVTRADGSVEDLGVLAERKTVTTTGVKWLADLLTASPGSGTMNFHDSGTGTTASAAADTDLQTPAGPTTRATGTRVSALASPNATYVSVGTITYTSTLAITEWILANQAARGAGTIILDHVAPFTAINVNNGDSITFTFTCSLNSGS